MNPAGERFLRWRKRALWLAGAYAAVALISWQAVPWAVRKALSKVPAALPGFSASAERVDFNPFSLRLRVEAVELSHEELGELASCREVSLALNPLALFKFAIGLREIKFVEPRLTLKIAKNGESVLDFLPKSSTKNAPPSAWPTFVPRVVIGAFEVSRGALEFESRMPSAPQKVSASPIDFRLENLSTIPGESGSYSLQALTNRGERLHWDGELTVRPPSLSGHVAVENVDLTRLSTALPSSAVFFEAGRLTALSDYELSFDSGALSAALSDAKVGLSGVLWRLKTAPEKRARGPFSLEVGPARVDVAAVALGTPQGKVTVRADVPVERTGQVRLRLYLTPKPLAGGAQWDVARLPLAPFSPLAPPPTQFSLDGGTLTVRGRADYAAGQVEGETSLSVADFKLSDKASATALVKYSRFIVESAKISTKRHSVEVAAVRLEDPFLRLSRDKSGKIGVATAFGLSLSSAAAQAPQSPSGKPVSSSAWKFRLRRFSLDRGRVLIQDDAVAPPFALNVSAARVELSGLADDARSTATFSAAAKIEQAPVSADGVVRLSTSAAWGQAKLKGEGIQLPLFSAYSGKFAGYKIEEGSFGFDLDDKIEGRAIATQNHAKIDRMSFGDKVDSPDAIKAPVKLGLAILKDRNGVIDLNVPVDGSLDDPDFHIAGAVIKTLADLIVKAALSPFSAMGAMMGSQDDLGAVAFAPGSAALTEALSARLDKVAKFLADRPGILVGVRGAATQADSLSAGDQELMRRLRGKEPGSEPLTPKEEARIMSWRKEFLGAEAATPAQARADLDAKWRAGDAEMRALALARADAIRDALAARGVATDRFFSLEPLSGADIPDEPSKLQLDVR